MLPPTGVYPWLKTSNIPIPETPVKKGRPQPSHSRRSTQLLQAERSAGRTRFSRLSSLVREQPGQRLAHRAHERRELLRLDELRRDERERRGERSVLGLVADLPCSAFHDTSAPPDSVIPKRLLRNVSPIDPRSCCSSAWVAAFSASWNAASAC